MHCPLCQSFLGEGEDLQFHYLLGCTAYTANRAPEDDENGERLVGVRLRWAKVSPCVERIVHVISSLAGSIPLHWSDIEGLYESALTNVLVGTHSCQLAIGGDLVPLQDFDIQADTDVVYIVPVEEDVDEGGIDDELENIIDEHDDPVADLLASQSYQRDEHSIPDRPDRYDGDDNGDNDGDDENRADLCQDGNHSNPIELSPLYKELLEHQVLHGEPAWIPSSGNQSPTSSDQEIEEIIRETRSDLEPPLLSGQPAIPDDRMLKSPIPLKPLEIVELPEKPEKRESTEEKTAANKEKDGLSNSSSGTFSSFFSKGSSDQKQSPPVESDSSDEDGALQEQSLEESVLQINELPCPYSGTFLTSDLTDNVPAQTAPNDNAPVRDGPHVIGHESSGSPQNQPVRPVIDQLETRASFQERNRNANDQSEISSSPPNQPLGTETGQTGIKTISDQLLHSHERPLSTGSLSQSENKANPHSRRDSDISNQSQSRASPQVRPDSARSSQSEARTSPQARPGSARSNQSETRASLTDLSHGRPPSAGSTSQSGTRASPFDYLVPKSDSSATRTPLQGRPGSAQSDTRASPQVRPSSARSTQSELRASPRDRSIIDQSEDTRVSPHIRSSSARSTQSEPRASSQFYPPSSEQIMRRNSEPSGFSGRSQNILTPPLLDSRTAHIEKGGSFSSLRSRTSPRELPSPSEPSPSISQHSSARSSLHDTLTLPEKPQNGLHVEFTHSRDSDEYRRLPVDCPSPLERQTLACDTENGIPVSPREILTHSSRTDNGLPVDQTLPRERHIHFNDSRTLRQQPSRSAFTLTTTRTGSSHGSSKHHTDRSSSRHQYDGPCTEEDLMVVGHSITGTADRGQNGEERKRASPQQRMMEESFADELSKRTAAYEEEIKELKALNEELCQQLLSLEAAAALTEQDIKSSKALERIVKTMTGKLQEREKEIDELKTRVAELEKENKEIRDEQESLRTVNKLTYEDLNKVNSDLHSERTELRRKTYGLPMRTSTEDTIPQIEAMNLTLREKVNRLETEKRDLKSKYNDTKKELEKSKAEKSISEFRLYKAKSEADLVEKFDRYTDYCPTKDKHLGITNHKTTDSSGIGSSRYTCSDTNIDTAYKIGSHVTPSHALFNGSTKEYNRRDNPVTYGLSRTFLGTMDNGFDRERQRHRSLSSESSGSSLLEYEYGANMRIPYDNTSRKSRDNKVELRGTGSGRKARPHSYDGSRPITHYITDNYKHHPKSSTYTAYSSTKPYDYTRSSLNSSLNSDSSYGTTPYITKTGKTRDYSKPILPLSSGDVRLGKRVVVTRTCGNVGRGVVRYVGPLPNRPGSYVGVELDFPEGKHDGSFEGRQFFKCDRNRGIFVKFEKVIMCYN